MMPFRFAATIRAAAARRFSSSSSPSNMERYVTHKEYVKEQAKEVWRYLSGALTIASLAVASNQYVMRERFSSLEAKLDGMKRGVEGEISGLKGEIGGLKRGVEGEISGLKGEIGGCEVFKLTTGPEVITNL